LGGGVDTGQTHLGSLDITQPPLLQLQKFLRHLMLSGIVEVAMANVREVDIRAGW